MRQIVARLFTAATICYLIAVVVFSALQLAAPDRWWWLFLLNSVGVYLYAPLLLLLPLALLLRRWRLAGAAVAGLAGFGLIYGPALVPTPEPPHTGQPLTVMTYNMYGYNRETALVVDTIRQSGADVVGLQELNIRASLALERDLADLYPYRLLNPSEQVFGMGVLSKYPLRALGTLPGADWTGDPQIVEIETSGGPVRLVNFHAIAPLGPPTIIAQRIVTREQQMRALAAYAASAGVPVIATGDMNAPPGSGAQRAATATLRDAWAERGGSLGHTWPGRLGSQRRPPELFGVTLPLFFVRIDYVLHTPDLQTAWVRQGPVFTGSDHRAVIVGLVR